MGIPAQLCHATICAVGVRWAREPFELRALPHKVLPQRWSPRFLCTVSLGLSSGAPLAVHPKV
eukprot:8369414-Pyramimonas_sp.AAC.1